jgi:hypothetical protein
MRNVELLRQTLEHIEAQPDLWDQLHWAHKTDHGIACDFAGTALTLAGNAEFEWDKRAADGLEFAVEMANGDDIGETAADLLGLDPADADALFDPLNTLGQLRALVATLTADHSGASA